MKTIFSKSKKISSSSALSKKKLPTQKVISFKVDSKIFLKSFATQKLKFNNNNNNNNTFFKSCQPKNFNHHYKNTFKPRQPKSLGSTFKFITPRRNYSILQSNFHIASKPNTYQHSNTLFNPTQSNPLQSISFKSIHTTKITFSPVMYPLIGDPSEYGEGGDGLEQCLNEFGQELSSDPKVFEMYGVRRRFRITEGRKKFERKNGLRKRMWKREMAKRLEPIAKTFGNLSPEDWVMMAPEGPPPLVEFPPDVGGGRFHHDEDPEFE